jgi:hypothetical protein
MSGTVTPNMAQTSASVLPFTLASPLNAALWRVRARLRWVRVIFLNFAFVWARLVGSGLEPESGG